MKGIIFRSDIWRAKLRVLEEYGEAQTRRLTGPRYQVGEVVYVKEAWAVGAQWDNRSPREIDRLTAVWYPNGADLLNIPIWVGKMRSPLFMMEWMARYYIKILGVRAERLQEITDKDAIAEGAELGSARGHFSILWDNINPKFTWSTNPWVLAYTFEMMASRAIQQLRNVQANVRFLSLEPLLGEI